MSVRIYTRIVSDVFLGLQGDPGSPTQAWALSSKEILLPQVSAV